MDCKLWRSHHRGRRARPDTASAAGIRRHVGTPERTVDARAEMECSLTPDSAHAQVQWPGPSQRRPDESNSSSEDQTAYEHSHSHASHQSRELGPAAPRTCLKRRLEVRAVCVLQPGSGM